jgi:hypothetical protein
MRLTTQESYIFRSEKGYLAIFRADLTKLLCSVGQVIVFQQPVKAKFTGQQHLIIGWLTFCLNYLANSRLRSRLTWTSK